MRIEVRTNADENQPLKAAYALEQVKRAEPFQGGGGGGTGQSFQSTLYISDSTQYMGERMVHSAQPVSFWMDALSQLETVYVAGCECVCG